MIYIVLLESVHPSIHPHQLPQQGRFRPLSSQQPFEVPHAWSQLAKARFRAPPLGCWKCRNPMLRLPPQDQLWSGCPNSRPQKSLAGSRNPPRGTTHGLHDFTVDYSTWASTLNLNAAASLSAAKVRQDNPLNTWTGNYWRVWRWCCERDLTESWMCPELGQWNRNLQSLLTEKFGTRRFQFV